MMKYFAAIVFLILFAFSATAQTNYWVQIEAHRTLNEAQERASAFDQRLENITGFYIGNGFYGIFIGPFSESDAQRTLQQLLGRDAIPSDSYINDGRTFRQQFWPVGGGTTGSVAIPSTPTPAIPVAPLIQAEETVREARAAEAGLSRAEREELQRALQWAGFYNAAIDGSFGRGTRAAMAAWQLANSRPDTGVLTTLQRSALLNDYNSVLDGLNLQTVRDDASGIQMQIPTGIVAFTEYQPPFVQFGPVGDVPEALVLFISQAGDSGKMRGLYEIMQVLDVVPTEGPRRFTSQGFEIAGISETLRSHVSVSLVDDQIKGFALIWPSDDEKRRTRMLDIMSNSFERLSGTLDPRIVPATTDQAIDMVAGLAIRQPRLSRSGFYVSNDGVVVTTPEVLENCDRITIDRDADAEVVLIDVDLGIAVLRPTGDAFAPIDFARFQTSVPRLEDDIVVAGFPFDGVLTAPTLTFGKVADIRGLTGDERVKRLTVSPQPSDAGGPVLDKQGAVTGMLLPRNLSGTQVLPPEVNFAVNATQITKLLGDQGIASLTAELSDAISPVALNRKATDMTVLVSCW